jgi:hydrogenase maturation protein HypF
LRNISQALSKRPRINDTIKDILKMSEKSSTNRLSIKVRGTVQGVGFRPYVYGLATDLDLKGYVSNTSDGVDIDVEGEGAAAFVDRLRKEAPPLAHITQVDITPMPPRGYSEFGIIESEEQGSFTLISPDVSICEDCLRELFDPKDRRYRYPFINCTNCGPRYSITKRVPYDRPNTTMSVFRLCPDCESEYRDPGNRRFHAEPNACPVCGPDVRGHGSPYSKGEDPIARTVELLKEGAIAAIKGLGGFHLACDAANSTSVENLRERKRRSNKPFALMARDIVAVKKYCHVNEREELLLLSNRRPIVLLRKKGGGPALPEAVAPGNNRLGFMLPSTPLHYLLFDGIEVLVMTSGNISEEPIQVDNDEALVKLEGMADAFLTHNRDIFMRVDDSVMKCTGDVPVAFVRRARGHTPEPIQLEDEGPDVLASGADIKCAFTLMKGPYAIVSQHIGDMENYETLRFFEETLANLKAVYRAEPVALAHDLHPGYLSTRWALKQDIPLLGVQHHHAHIASVMAEHRLKGKVIGVAMDGTGYGTDGTLWGGEFLIADSVEFTRSGHLKHIPLPGGESAVREPWRTAIGYMRSTFGKDVERELEKIGFYDRFGREGVENIIKVADMPQVSPLSSGLGRLFDAVSSILCICDTNTFEGEAPIALEAAAENEINDGYPVNIKFRLPMEVDFTYTLVRIINDVKGGVDRGVIAARFHNTVVDALHRVVEKLSRETGIMDVALSGGSFQNDILLERLKYRLESSGLNVFANHAVPLNDGCISLGQAYILREHINRGLIKTGP